MVATHPSGITSTIESTAIASRPALNNETVAWNVWPGITFPSVLAARQRGDLPVRAPGARVDHPGLHDLTTVRVKQRTIELERRPRIQSFLGLELGKLGGIPSCIEGQFGDHTGHLVLPVSVLRR